MRVKHYEFTEDEAFVLRDALENHWHEHVKGRTFTQPLFIRQAELVRPLLEQFADDCRLWK